MITFQKSGLYIGEINIGFDRFIFPITDIKYENTRPYKSAVRMYGAIKEKHHLEIGTGVDVTTFIFNNYNTNGDTRALDLNIYKLIDDDVTCDFFTNCDLDASSNTKLRLTSHHRISDIISIELFRRRDDIKIMFESIKRDLKLEKLID